MIYVKFHLYIQRMSRSMIKQQNSGATAHVVLYTPRQSTNNMLGVTLIYPQQLTLKFAPSSLSPTKKKVGAMHYIFSTNIC